MFAFSRFVECIRQQTLSTILSIKVLRHEHTRSAYLMGTFASQPGDLAVLVNFVVLQNCKLHLFWLAFDFLWRCVVLLLSFLTTTTEAQHQVESGFFLNVVVTQCTTIF